VLLEAVDILSKNPNPLGGLLFTDGPLHYKDSQRVALTGRVRGLYAAFGSTPNGEGAEMNKKPARKERPSSRMAKIIAVLLLVFAAAAILWWQPWGSRTELEVWFFERPPYHMQNERGEVSGVFADRVSVILNAAGIDLFWVAKPASLHLDELKKNDRPMCISGWFKNEERENYAKYTEVIYRDKPFVVFARANDKRILEHDSVHGLVADSQLKFGWKDTFSYGNELDRLLQESQTPITTTPSDTAGMIQMLLKRKFDYTFVGAEEAEELKKQARGWAKKFIYYEVPDMPPTQGRYLACTRKVNDDLLKRIDEAIVNLGFDQN
jgi:uncharacterized protein (TIGR02285 family)